MSQTGQRARQTASAPQPHAKCALHETMYTETRSECEATKTVGGEYQAKYHKTVESVAAHRKRRTAFFDSWPSIGSSYLPPL
jgi:hypothetical protein